MRMRNRSDNAVDGSARKGMVLPFTPLSLAFDHVNYYVDMPAVSPLSTIYTCILPYEYLVFINSLNRSIGNEEERDRRHPSPITKGC